MIRVAREAKADAIHTGYGLLSENPDFAEALILMKRFGMREERAFAMSRAMRLAALIVDGESEGGEFDFETWTWKKRD